MGIYAYLTLMRPADIYSKAPPIVHSFMWDNWDLTDAHLALQTAWDRAGRPTIPLCAICGDPRTEPRADTGNPVCGDCYGRIVAKRPVGPPPPSPASGWPTL